MKDLLVPAAILVAVVLFALLIGWLISEGSLAIKFAE